jgi:hypothetical protein
LPQNRVESVNPVKIPVFRDRAPSTTIWANQRATACLIVGCLISYQFLSRHRSIGNPPTYSRPTSSWPSSPSPLKASSQPYLFFNISTVSTPARGSVLRRSLRDCCSSLALAAAVPIPHPTLIGAAKEEDESLRRSNMANRRYH